ncbi:MAG: hypothetical protein EHM81_04650, partial [Chloroflexi bacterium]
MRKFFLFLSIFPLILAACGSNPAPVSGPKPTASKNPAKPTPAATRFTSTCTKSLDPAANTNEPSLFPPVSELDHITGPADAAVTIIEYSDFQCNGCAQMTYVMAYLVQKFGAQIRLVYRPFPLTKVYDKAALSAQAAEAANLQGKFWDMHNLLFGRQAEWWNLTPDQFEKWLGEQAGPLGLETAKFKADLKSPETVNIVAQAQLDGQDIGLGGVPLLLINGEIQKPPYILSELENIVSLKLLMTRQFHECPPLVIDPAKKYTAKLKTDKGDIVIRLFADRAPNTVNNFVFLAQRGWYDNITFYRVLAGYFAQTGDPSETGLGNPGYFIPDEIDP